MTAANWVGAVVGAIVLTAAGFIVSVALTTGVSVSLTDTTGVFVGLRVGASVGCTMVGVSVAGVAAAATNVGLSF
jgi:hypothetical protein